MNRIVHKTSLATCVLAVTVLVLSGCVAPHYESQSWGSGFERVGVAYSSSSVDGSSSPVAAVVPRRCLAGPDQSAVLPLGCINDLNLQRMVARPSDLLRGHEMGPSRAAPVARAASVALDPQGKRTATRNAAVRQQAQSQVTGYGLP